MSRGATPISGRAPGIAVPDSPRAEVRHIGMAAPAPRGGGRNPVPSPRWSRSPPDSPDGRVAPYRRSNGEGDGRDGRRRRQHSADGRAQAPARPGRSVRRPRPTGRWTVRGSGPRVCADRGARSEEHQRRQYHGDERLVPGRPLTGPSDQGDQHQWPGNQQNQDRRGQLDQQRGGPEPDVGAGPPTPEQETGRASGVIRGRDPQAFDVRPRKEERRMHDDARIEDDVDGPDQEPGHQRHHERLPPEVANLDIPSRIAARTRNNDEKPARRGERPLFGRRSSPHMPRRVTRATADHIGATIAPSPTRRAPPSRRKGEGPRRRGGPARASRDCTATAARRGHRPRPPRAGSPGA